MKFSNLESKFNIWPKEMKIVNLFLSQFLIIATLLFLIIIYFWINEKNTIIEYKLENTQEELIEAQKQKIKNETEKAIEYINYEIESTQKNFEKRLITRVNLAYSIAINIYNQNINTKPVAEIKELIKSTLRPIQFDDGRCQFFIVSLDGYYILSPAMPELEGKYHYNLQDAIGNFVIQDEINIVKKQQEGFVTGYWKNPELDTAEAFKKLSYVKLFDPFNWYIGSGEYYNDFKKIVKGKVLERLSHYRFDEEGYIFVNTYDGDALLKNGNIVQEKKNIWNLEDPKGIKIIQEERKAVKNPDGGFIDYSWKKLTSQKIVPRVSFVKGVPEWRWMIGAGVYIDDIDQILLNKKAELQKSVRNDIIIILIIICIVFIFLFLLLFYIRKKAKKNIESFLEFFKNAIYKYEHIDISKFNFSEFKTLAASANDMIEELKKSENRKQEEEAHYERLFKSAPEAIALINNEGYVIRVNQAFAKFFGFNNEELKGKDLNDFIVSPGLKEQAIEYSNQIKKGFDIEVEDIRIKKDKTKVYVQILATPILVNKKQIGIYVIYRDITQQKEAEQKLYDAKVKAEESDRLKTAFLTNLSHEVRTPMNAIIGFTTLLNNNVVSEEDQKTYFQIMAKSGKSLVEIIDNIIDVAKIEAESLVLNKTTCNINTILDELLVEYQEIREENDLENIKISLYKELSEDLTNVITDSRRIKQIFSNLLDNALKFTEKGEIEFGYLENLGEVEFFVKDSGIGIAEEEIEFIFERFRQADETTTRKYGGTGIGLTLCKKLVELLDGRIWVVSEKGNLPAGKAGGSTFYFTIPYETVKKKKPKKPEEIIINEINWSDKKILIAEDVLTNYQYLETLLLKTNARVSWAQDGKEAIDIIENDPDFDLILMDINMPIMTGHEAVVHLKQKGCKIPIIAQTAYAMEHDRVEILNQGYNDYILKPIEIHQFYFKLSKFLD